MTGYKTRVFDFTVNRRTSDGVYGEDAQAGDVQRIEVGCTRSKSGESNDARYTVSYTVKNGAAQVATVEPTNRSHSDPVVNPAHLAAILDETDPLVRSSVPEVEGVVPVRETLRSERSDLDGAGYCMDDSVSLDGYEDPSERGQRIIEAGDDGEGLDE